MEKKCCYLGYDWKKEDEDQNSRNFRKSQRGSERDRRLERVLKKEKKKDQIKVPYQQWFLFSEYSSCVQ